MTSSWGGVLVKMMVDGRGGVKSPNWGVHGPIYLNMTLSYRNNAGIVVCLYQLFIYFRKKGKHVNFLVMAA